MRLRVVIALLSPGLFFSFFALFFVDAAAAAAHDGDAYERHVAALRKRLPPGAFHIVVEKPFVVVGDGPAEDVRASAEGTVRWTVQRLKALYFTKDPRQILTIWLFKDRDSYRRNARRLFGEVPSTPYGYYSSGDRALVMNISTGGGTLVHELVHPFMEANFEGVPAWFNEGLGSLYEQSAERGGRIRGLTNWRLAGLQRLIARKAMPTFRKLLTSGDHAFYRDAIGDNYAQARYLCYYLQERGLLQRYYHAFHAAKDVDPTGYATLAKVLGLGSERAMRVFEQRFAAWVSTLEFP